MKKKYKYLIVIFLMVASSAAFGRIASNDFILFDDNYYITENDYIKSGINLESIKWAFTSTVANNWHPLTMLSHMLDWSLFGGDATGHHILNLLLHIGTVVFLFLFLNKTTKNIWSAAFAAAFFALHPLRVESVAWASERKDVLSMFFGMAVLYAYFFYAESSKLSRYFVCLIFFTMALMSKSMMVTLPFVMLLLDYWPLKRWQYFSSSFGSVRKTIERLVWEKVPFFILAIAISILTIKTQSSIENLPFHTRFANGIVSYSAYLIKTCWPVNLAVYYPYNFSLPFGEALIPAIVLALITGAVLYYIKKFPFLFMGWFWYLGTLVPVIGLVQVGYQAMADRYTYLPSVGIAVMLSWGIPLFFKREDLQKKILFPAGIATLAILAILARQQCGYWKNSIKLWNHTMQVTENNAVAHFYLGVAYADLGQYQRAIEDYNEAIRLRPDYAYAYYNRGNIYGQHGQYQLAIKNFDKAIRLKPYYANFYYNRGTTYVKLGQQLQAIEDFNQAIRLKPNLVEAHNNRGIAYLKQGNIKLGCNDLQNACKLGYCKSLEIARGDGVCH